MNQENKNAPGRDLTRREFVKLTVASSLAVSAGASVWAAESKNDIPYRALGRTGEKVSVIGLGGYHIGIPAETEGIRLIRSAIDRGINFMDNCWDYHNGGSEICMGKALKDGYRDKVFLMSKIDGQTKTSAAKQIDESLKRLQTDHIDLMQFHEVIRPGDPDRIFGEGGSAEAMLEAKKAGKIRFIGFTGHKDPEIHLKCLRVAKEHQFRFDAVQMPLNVMDAHFRSFGKKVVPVLVKEGIGVLGMKPLGSGAILRSNTVKPIECLHYAMSLPTSTVITGCDNMRILDQAIEAARTFKPLNEQEVSALLARTANAAAEGQYERFKTGTNFDGTAQNPQWLG
ncbi:MAG TPA: aldo/keto reductase [Verrucomicrobiae bacterium]|jgi:predicted aldo/keto reductase-like oxidoreductase|nr:aldo/keto reductase [Verrucomicrobiae bacterium]